MYSSLPALIRLFGSMAAFVFGCSLNGWAQPITAPSPYAAAPGSYVKSWQALGPIQDGNAITISPVTTAQQTTQYLDGLGRPVQTVAKQASPLQQDVVTPVVYDAYGRTPYSYMPFVSVVAQSGDVTNDGNFKLDAFQQDVAFNTAQFSGEQYFYSQTNYELSPLNRPLTTYAPGNNWVGSSRGVGMQYLVNGVSDSVHIWNIGFAPGSIPTDGGQYGAGTLLMTVTTDEQSHQVVEYKDEQGHVLLKKVQSASSPGTAHVGWLCTYYVYDDLEHLRFVISPRASEIINTGVTWTIAQAVADGLCFRYEYDTRSRMIIKKVPGAGENHMIFDSRDRIVMSQDSNLRVQQQWLVTAYDALNRPDSTGLINDPTYYDNQAYYETQAMAGGEYPNWALYTNQLLTQTFYDGYTGIGAASGLPATMSTRYTTNSYYFLTNYNSSPSWPVPITQHPIVRGLVTGTKTMVLGTTSNQYLYSESFYDDRGRVIQTQSINYTGAVDTVTTQYNFVGKPLRTLLGHAKLTNTAQSHKVLTKINYDAGLRVTGILKNIDSAATDERLSGMQYNELSQLHAKFLGNNPATGTALDYLMYDYNIRGWMLGVNRGYIADTATHYFGMELAYDKTASVAAGTSYTTPAYNGNIAGTVWKSAGDGVDRKYDFTYDNVNRLAGGAYTDNLNGGSWGATKMDYSVYGMAYDANGNIKNMSQNGFKVGAPTQAIDLLTYSYQANGNQLSQVVDGANDTASTLGDFHYKGTKGSYDYTYDPNGNINLDANKGLDTYVYDYLNLLQSVHMKGKGNIVYTYDAAGDKILKTTTDSTAGLTTSTLYLDGFEYQRRAPITSPATGFDTLQFVAHEEGRARWAYHIYTGTVPPAYGWEYDFSERDHLGNTRVLLSQEKDTAQYMCTLEPQYRATEDALFYNIGPSSYPAASVPGISGGFPAPPNGPATNDSVIRLNGNGPNTGPAIILKVMAGDKITMGTYYYYVASTASSPTPLTPQNLLNSLASGLESLSSIGGEGASTLGNTASSPLLAALTSSISNEDVPGTSKPQAYLNWMLLDNQFNLVPNTVSANQNGAQQVGAAGLNGSALQSPLAETITAAKSGYLYIYLSNTTPGWDVFFDNLSIAHYSSPLIEENHYYPFGLSMAGISDQAIKTQYAVNKYRFNGGNELQNKEFSDGSGLEEYDATFRMYDPQIGRFNQIDPLGELSEDWSPYVFAFDNPVYFNDPLGLAPNDSASSFPVPRPPLKPACIVCGPPPDPANDFGPPPSNVGPPIDNNSNPTPWMDRIGFDVTATHGVTEESDPTNTIASNALKYTGVNESPTTCAWCAAYGSITLHNSGFSDPKAAASRLWLKSKDLMKTGPYFGAIAIFQDYSDPSIKIRTGLGHVGFLYGITPYGKYIILGGNQGNTIKFSEFGTTSGYIKGIGYMHLEGFYFPIDYYGSREIAPIYQSAKQLNRFLKIISSSNTTR